MDDDFQYLRKPAESTSPNTAVFKWWADMPHPQRPYALAKAFPRILNNLALCWDNFGECEAYLSSLIFNSNRTSRQGFPNAVVEELLALHNYRTAAKSHVDKKMDTMFTFKFGSK